MQTIDEYEESYKDFSKPLMYVKVGENKVENEDLAYTFLTTEMSIGNEASYCKFTIISRDTSCKDNKLSIPSTLSEKFKLGDKVEIYLGYTVHTTAKLVFIGYVTSINVEYTGKEDVSYTIEAMDLKIFMMNNSRSEIKKDMKSYSAVVTKILKDYSPLCEGDLEVSETKEIKSPIEQYNESDYDFIVSLAKKLNYRFFVCKGKAHFIELKPTDPVIKISPSKYLYSIEREISISKQIQSVTVRTNDEKDSGKPIESTVESITTNDKEEGDSSIFITKKLLPKSKEDEKYVMAKTIIDNSVRSEEEAKARAQAELNRLAMDFVSGECELIGIPELEPGKFIEIEDINESIDGNYLITSIKHVFDSEGYKTICKFGASKI